MKISKAITIMILAMAGIIITSCHGKEPKDINIKGLDNYEAIQRVDKEYKRYKTIDDPYDDHEACREYSRIKKEADFWKYGEKLYDISSMKQESIDRYIHYTMDGIKKMKEAYKKLPKKCKRKARPDLFK